MTGAALPITLSLILVSAGFLLLVASNRGHKKITDGRTADHVVGKLQMPDWQE